MNNRDNSTTESTERSSSASRFAVPQLSLSDDERALIETDPYEFVVLMKDDGARDTEISSKLRLANLSESDINELMQQGDEFVKENRYDLGKSRLKSGLGLLGVGIAVLVVGFMIGFMIVFWGGIVTVLVGGGQTVRGMYQMMTSKKEANVGS